MSARRIYPLLLLLIVTTLLSSCAEVRKLTYPGDITYIDRSKVTGAMRQMSDSVTRLESIIGAAPQSGNVDQQAVVRELTTLEKLASSLQVKKGYSNQKVIDEHIDNFLENVSVAREAAEHSPPNYYLAGRIAGSCAACHRIR
jgi:uncharacterized protein YceK